MRRSIHQTRARETRAQRVAAFPHSGRAPLARSRAFEALDGDKSGQLDLQELKAVFAGEAGHMMRELDLVERDGKVSLVEWTQFFEQYRALDGGHAAHATNRALEGLETAIELHDQMAAHDAEILKLEARLAGGADGSADEPPPASPRSSSQPRGGARISSCRPPPSAASSAAIATIASEPGSHCQSAPLR